MRESHPALTPLLPSIARTLAAAKPGHRHILPQPPGSGDAWWLAQLAQTCGQPVVVLTADPLDAQRLTDEIALLAPTLRLRAFPDWETLPYDSFSPHQDLISERLRTLHALTHHVVDILTVPVTTALYRLAPPAFLAAYTFAFRQGDKLDEAALRAQLILANYSHVTQVNAPGEFSIRGSLMDLYPMGSDAPYRIDLFDDEIESIRRFDVDTQRSLDAVQEVQLLPGREFPMDQDARHRFRARFREVFDGDPSRALPYKDIGNGIAFAGVEYYLPLFFEQTATLFDYLPGNTLMVTMGKVDTAVTGFLQDTRSRYQFLQSDRERPLLPPEALFLDSEALFRRLKDFARIALTSDVTRAAQATHETQAADTADAPATTAQDASHTSTSAPQPHPDILPAPPLAVERRAHDPVARLRALLHDETRRIALCAQGAGRRETLLHMLAEFGLTPDGRVTALTDFLHDNCHFALLIAPLSAGFALKDANIVFLTENDLYPQHATRGRHRRHAREAVSDVEHMVRDLSELRLGDPVVHAQHGIARYHGLMTMDMGEGQMEFLHLEYAKQATLYVPVDQLHVIARYSGADPEHAPLHQLGSGQWDKARRKAAQQARDTAAELLALYAQRAAREGMVFKLPASDYQAFAEGFGFEETPDQAAAIEAVIGDMTSGRPMDRLVCGDVGFGKTEVALRAAFVAAMNGRQTALLCPTTLLAEQHAQTFANRFADWPVRIVELSRFRSAKEITAAVQGLRDGSIDVVIGTHKLLSKQVQFKRLGLVIIDEEHRFGVRQKEALKALRAEVDVLTLTATPIPRTLGMSLEGIRDFSVIATAPQKRLAIKTFVRREDGSTIREALLRELKRGGQVYFLHNEIDTIAQRRAMLQELVPEARIAVAHGQMAERELETVMKGFYQQRSNVLLCTTIIETGIDVPTANTIVIHRADRLGLAQLHQLRGRVGRSHHQAYAYLLTPGEDAMTSNAKKRLEAIAAMEELGAGFYLAMHDLEIRGAGEVLGESQSGNIHEIGFSLYADMLNAAVRALKSGQEPDLESPFDMLCEVKLHAPALLPCTYCPDVHARLGFYKTLAHAKCEDDLTTVQEALIDRYGPLPDAARVLLQSHRLRIIAEPLGLIKIDAHPTQAVLQFSNKPNIDPTRILHLLQSRRDLRLAGSERLLLDLSKRQDTVAARVDAVHNLLNTLR